MANIIVEKSEAFALSIIQLYQYLTEDAPKREYVLSKQLLRSGTSIGANIAEAECAISRDDFKAKMYISYKECSESLYWLRLLYKAGYIDKTNFDNYYSACEELFRMLASITKTAKEKSK